MNELFNPIRCLLVDRRFDGGPSTQEHLLMGNKVRHFAKRLTGSYTTPLDLASMSSLGWAGVGATWVANGSDDYPTNPRIQLWNLPGMDFMFHGRVIFFGIAKSERTSVPADLWQKINDLWMQQEMGQVRKSAYTPVL